MANGLTDSASPYLLQHGSGAAFRRARAGANLIVMTRYRFLDPMGDVVAEGDFAEHAEALAWAEDDEREEELQRVEYLGPEGTWRWAGALRG